MNAFVCRLGRVSALLLSAWFGLTACNNPDPNLLAPDFGDRITFMSARQYPEGITFSPVLNRFLVTSITQGKVGTVDDDGEYMDLFSDAQLISAIGIKEFGGKIYVCNGDQGVSSKSTAQSRLRTAGLFVYNLATNQVERRTDLAALLPNSQHFANDVALDPQGVAYVTDSFAPVVYRVGADGQASVLVNDPVLAPPTGQFGLNGIVYHPGNFLIVAKAATGQLYKINLASNNAITEITGLPTLTGADGMTLIGADLYVVNNRNRVTQLRSSDNWATASTVKVDEAGYEGATTNAAFNGQIYTLNGRIGEVGAAAMAGNPASLTASSYTIQRFR
ncbi:gluconolaconase [Rudanella paleaurantiibacter]|uniref:Gluconolaconase n=1 Tax=Rudanella paleaurantiibacter TaxID=2614655 RepID=A0A7J5TTD0_9BACT|nr:gluconolaconase [Rudanella paleaurantiibacter]KAB7727067.1 gluconolaconase [Rudanella paleaurantiibacter]